MSLLVPVLAECVCMVLLSQMDELFLYYFEII